MFKYNMNQDKRDTFFKIRKEEWDKPTKDYFGFYDLDVEILKILLDEKFANPDEYQNEAPTIQKFYDFMVKHPEFKAHGYATGGTRTDYRVSVEGVKGIPSGYESRYAFYKMFRLADEFDEYHDGTFRCWYD